MHRLRCLTLNLWSAAGPVERRLELVAKGISELQPDVVALQEVRELPGKLPNTARTLATRAGLECAFASAAIPGADGDWGLAVLSRTPILEQATLDLPEPEPGERRILLSAQVSTPVGPVWIHDTHLNYRLQDGRQRELQVQAIHDQVAARAGDLPQILMGDFNARPESDEIRWLRGQTTLGGRRVFFQDAWICRHPSGEPGFTWAAANPYVAHFLDADRRLDYIFVTPERKDGRGRVHECRIVLDRPDERGVYPSDHFGVYAEVQLDPG